MTALNSSLRSILLAILVVLPAIFAAANNETVDEDVIACVPQLTESSLCKCQIMDLHPTQFSVGMIAVQKKRDALSDLKDEKLKSYKKKHPEPVVIDPNGLFYIVDHHHLALALLEAGEKNTYCQIAASHYGQTTDFWSMMQNRGWVYPYERGRGPLPYSSLPANVLQMSDDPYRSLVAEVRDAGDIDKTAIPFAEFQWADYFRPLIPEADIAADFDKAVKAGRKLAHLPAASRLPGYRED